MRLLKACAVRWLARHPKGCWIDPIKVMVETFPCDLGFRPTRRFYGGAKLFVFALNARPHLGRRQAT